MDKDCKNGGKCSAKTKRCECIDGTSGVTCEIITDCGTLKCEEKSANCKFDAEKKTAFCECKDENFYFENEKCNSKYMSVCN